MTNAYCILDVIIIRNSADISDISQGQKLFKNLGKDEIEQHTDKIRERYDFLETFLGQTKFIATDYVSLFGNNTIYSGTFTILS